MSSMTSSCECPYSVKVLRVFIDIITPYIVTFIHWFGHTRWSRWLTLGSVPIPILILFMTLNTHPLGYCITWPSYPDPSFPFMNFGQRVQEFCATIRRYFITYKTKENEKHQKNKQKQYYCIIFVWAPEITYFSSVGPLGNLFRGGCH